MLAISSSENKKKLIRSKRDFLILVNVSEFSMKAILNIIFVKQWEIPASNILVTTVASMSGTNPSIILDPFIIDTSATHTQSFMPIVFPFRMPSFAPSMSHFQYLQTKLNKDKQFKHSDLNLYLIYLLHISFFAWLEVR